MNRFTADYSSSIGSSAAGTPAHQRDLLSSGPALSTTPLVPPPSAIFGSSQIGASKVRKSLFQKSTQPDPKPTPPSQKPFRFNAPPSQPASRPFHTSFKSSVSSTYDEQPEDEYEEDGIEEDDPQFQPRVSQPSLMKFSTNSARQSTQKSLNRRLGPSSSQLPRKGKPDVVPGYARDLTARAKPAKLERDDGLILDTEDVLQRLQEAVRSADDDEGASRAVDGLVQELSSAWRRHSSEKPFDSSSGEIGPSASASPYEKATYISSLLFTLYHQSRGSNGNLVPRTKALLDWLDSNHVSYNHIFREVANATPNVTSHDFFWDAVWSMTLRGKLHDVMRLLQEADFKYAASARDDGEEEEGYRGSQLQTIQGAIYHARQLVNACPFMHGDWDIESDDWQVYRSHLDSDLQHLSQLANQTQDEDDQGADSFGLRRKQPDLFAQSQKRQNLPFSIFQGIKLMYAILMGSTAEIITQSQDWLEASIALTIWWDGSKDSSITKWSLGVSRAQEFDDANADPYLARLRDAFLCVTDPDAKSSFQLNGLSPTEVGIGCTLQGDIESVLAIMQRLSQCEAAAVAEVATMAGWLSGMASDPHLDANDLMVLSFGAPRSSITKDDILQDYATALFGRPQLRTGDAQVVEGWELALTVLRRMDEEDAIHDLVSELLSQLDVSDQARAEKAINLCTDLGLIREARTMSERFGDYLIKSTTNYGTALLCYARSHQPQKIQQLTDMLIGYCLVQSRAYPSEDEIDDGLRALVENPKMAFADIAEFDPDAAASLQFFMVGYACVRRFYNLRDDKAPATSGQKRTSGPLARRRTAAKALVAAINSAADSIYGGLYDSTRQSAIQVDGLLTLLGEASAFLASDSKRVLTSDQMLALLAAIEDLETVSSRVYDQAEECLQASLRNYHGSLPPSPHAMLKKSMSSGTNSNFSFSMMGSEMLARSGESAGGRSEGSAFLVNSGKNEPRRAWDWRAHFKDQDVTGKTVLRYLRSEIARELSMAELEDM